VYFLGCLFFTLLCDRPSLIVMSNIESFPSRSYDSFSSWWRSLFRPMLLMSVALHALILAIPLPSTPEAKPEEKPEESVQLSSLVASPTPKPAASPVAKKAAPKPLPKAASTIPALIARPRPIPNPVATRTPAATPAPPAPVSPSPEFDPSELQAALQASLQGTEGTTGLKPFPGVFDQPLAFYSSEEDTEPLAGITAMQWFDNMRADSVFAKLQDNYQPRGFTFDPIGEYGGGQIYELKTAKGQTVSFINVVPGKGGASTVVITWEYDPNSPPTVPPAAQ